MRRRGPAWGGQGPGREAATAHPVPCHDLPLAGPLRTREARKGSSGLRGAPPSRKRTGEKQHRPGHYTPESSEVGAEGNRSSEGPAKTRAGRKGGTGAVATRRARPGPPPDSQTFSARIPRLCQDKGSSGRGGAALRPSPPARPGPSGALTRRHQGRTHGASHEDSSGEDGGPRESQQSHRRVPSPSSPGAPRPGLPQAVRLGRPRANQEAGLGARNPALPWTLLSGPTHLGSALPLPCLCPPSPGLRLPRPGPCLSPQRQLSF